MKVKEIIKKLQEYPQDSDVDFIFNPIAGVDDSFDIETELSVIGDTVSAPTIIMTPVIKPSEGFETLCELMAENPTKITIELEKSGMYIFSDGELRREMNFKQPCDNLWDNTDAFVKGIIKNL